MSQNTAVKVQLQQIGFTIQYVRELEEAVSYLESLGAVLPVAGRHAAGVSA